MWERLQRFRALDPAARRIFWRGALLLPLIFFSLRLRGFRATQTALQRLLSAVNGANLAADAPGCLAEAVTRTARMVRAAAHYSVGRATCLEESLALWWLLARQGIPSSVRIGTRKSGGQFEAHAWVECDGIALDEGAVTHRHYAAFDATFPSLPAERS